MGYRDLSKPGPIPEEFPADPLSTSLQTFWYSRQLDFHDVRLLALVFHQSWHSLFFREFLAEPAVCMLNRRAFTNRAMARPPRCQSLASFIFTPVWHTGALLQRFSPVCSLGTILISRTSRGPESFFGTPCIITKQKGRGNSRP